MGVLTQWKLHESLGEERRGRKRGAGGGKERKEERTCWRRGRERGREELEEERRGWKRGAGGGREETGRADQVKTPSSFT